MTPLKQLVVWVVAQGGRVRRDAYHARGVALGCPPPAQNGAYGTQRPLLVRDGDECVVTDYGRARATAWFRKDCA
jgi:hypothetical protein